jgi:DNA-directed RNA polymerase subunit M/transcription elongation factor TFIIS
MTSRQQGKKALETVLGKAKNVQVFEKAIFDNTDGEEKYRECIFQVVGDVINKVKLPVILRAVKSRKHGWDHKMYDEITYRLKERDDFIVTPFDVAEGVLECPRCASMRTFSYQLQLRSCDEPMTTFAQCVACRKRWTYSG